MKVLVTGALGNIGEYAVAALLEEGHEVIAFDLESPRTRKVASGLDSRVRLVWGDLTDPAALGATLEGVDAVVDKDRAAAILGADIGAEVLVILTDVECVYLDYGKPSQRALRRLTLAEADELMRTSELGTGSMAPKVEAATDFVRRGGRRAVIACTFR